MLGRMASAPGPPRAAYQPDKMQNSGGREGRFAKGYLGMLERAPATSGFGYSAILW